MTQGKPKMSRAALRCGSVAASLLKPGTKRYEKWLSLRNYRRKRNAKAKMDGLSARMDDMQKQTGKGKKNLIRADEQQENTMTTNSANLGAQDHAYLARQALEIGMKAPADVVPHRSTMSFGLESPEIMFWSEDHQPQDFAGQVGNVDHKKVTAVIEALKEGDTKASWKGWAECRICDEHLGSRDLGSHGFKWPSMAEHYIEEHGVWTPGLDQFAEALLGEEIEVEKDGTRPSCGVFIPLPYNLAKDFPCKKENDDSVPHYTVLYVGDMKPKAYKEFCNLVRKFAAKLKPFECDTAHYGEFLNPQGQKIPHMGPSMKCRAKLAIIHGLLRRFCEKLGTSVKHTYGKMESSAVPYEVQFKPHATLAYLPAAMPYKGPRPTGSWKVTELECWGHEQIRIPLGETRAAQPIGLTRSPLVAKYPMAVPDAVACEDEKPFMPEVIAVRYKKGDPWTRPGEHHEDVVGGSMGAVGKGVGGSSGDVGLDGSLPYLWLKQQQDKKLRRKKLAGLI